MLHPRFRFRKSLSRLLYTGLPAEQAGFQRSRTSSSQTVAGLRPASIVAVRRRTLDATTGQTEHLTVEFVMVERLQLAAPTTEEEVPRAGNWPDFRLTSTPVSTVAIKIVEVAIRKTEAAKA